MLVLVINPGSTSTKMAVYEEGKSILVRSISHSAEELSRFSDITDQFEFRKQLILDELKRTDTPFEFKAVIGRGGLIKPIQGGVYEVNEQMLDDARNAVHKHASNLGCIIAHEIAKDIPGCRSFIADPVVVDELNDYARITGSPLMPRVSIWHALNQKAIARRYAKETGRKYEDLNLIVCHLGGGITIAAHDHGKAVDVNNGLDGEGPLSPERAGSLPASSLTHLCFSGKYTEKDVMKMIVGNAGVAAHLGTNDMRDVENRVLAGDKEATLILDAMIYHVAKSIAAQGAVLFGKVDAILITGGLARSKYVIDKIRERVEYLAQIAIYPGEDEMEALANNATEVLLGEREAKVYK